MPNELAPQGDANVGKSQGDGGSSEDFAANLSREVNDMSSDKGAFGEKNDGSTDTQIDKTEKPGDVNEAAEQIADASDNPQELGDMMKESAEKAAQSMGKAGQKYESLKGTDQQGNAEEIAKFFGEKATNMGFGEVGKNITNGGFKAAGDAVKQAAKGYAESAKKD